MNILVDFLPGQSFELVFDLEPDTGPWEQVGLPENSAVQRRYRSAHYTCDLSMRRFREHDILSFEVVRNLPESGASRHRESPRLPMSFTVHRYGVRGDKDFVDTVPYNYRHTLNTIWNYSEISNASTTRKPFILYGNRRGLNKLALGFRDLALETEKTVRFVEDCERKPSTRGRLPTSLDREEFAMLRPYGGLTFTTEKLREDLFFSTRCAPWFDVESDYFDWIDAETGYVPVPLPRRYLGPVWCSWGLNLGIDEQAIWEQARAAAELGFRNVIIDAGWFHQTCGPWYSAPLGSDALEFGHIRPNPDKFPDLSGMVARIHRELDMGVQLWVCPRHLFTPFEDGPRALDRRLLGARIVTAKGERKSMLCARNPDARRHGAQLVRRLVEETGVDGLKFDAWFEGNDTFTCYADHEHDCQTAGEGIVAWAREVHEALEATGRELLIWFGPAGVKQYGNYWSNNDELYSHPDGQYLSGMQSQTENRPVFQICGADWHLDEEDVNVARFLAMAQCGMVPEAFTDLTVMRESHRRITRAWNTFFMAHMDELLYGRYRPHGWERNTGGPYSSMLLPVSIQAGRTAFFWATPVPLEELALEGECDALFIYNVQNEPGVALTVRNLAPGEYALRVKDICLETVAERRVACAGMLRVHLPVPVAGMAEVVRLASPAT